MRPEAAASSPASVPPGGGLGGVGAEPAAPESPITARRSDVPRETVAPGGVGGRRRTAGPTRARGRWCGGLARLHREHAERRACDGGAHAEQAAPPFAAASAAISRTRSSRIGEVGSARAMPHGGTRPRPVLPRVQPTLDRVILVGGAVSRTGSRRRQLTKITADLGVVGGRTGGAVP